MKRYYEYTKEELAAVSEDELSTLVDLEFAHAGVLPETSPTPLPSFDAGIKPTEVLYEVFNILFVNQSDAIAISQLQIATEQYDYYGAGYNYKYASFDRDNSVKQKLLYKKDDVLRMKSVLADRKKAEEAYEEAEKKYNKFVESTSQLRSEVINAYHEACNFIQSINLAKQMLEKYLKLADGNEDTAKNFFRDAYKGSPEIVKEVLHEELIVREV
jgi:hypothetical protein